MRDFFPLLEHTITEVLPPSLKCLALASGGSVSELAGTGSVGHRANFWQLLTEATPAAPPLPKQCHANPVHTHTKDIFHVWYFYIHVT